MTRPQHFMAGKCWDLSSPGCPACRYLLALEAALEQAVRDRDSLARRAVALEDEAEQRESALERELAASAAMREALERELREANWPGCCHSRATGKAECAFPCDSAGCAMERRLRPLLAADAGKAYQERLKRAERERDEARRMHADFLVKLAAALAEAKRQVAALVAEVKRLAARAEGERNDGGAE